METIDIRPLSKSERSKIADLLRASKVEIDSKHIPVYVGRRDGQYAYGYAHIDCRFKLRTGNELNEWKGVELPASILKNNP